jgi:nucleoporin GLE1
MKESHTSSNTFTARTSTFDSSFSSSTTSNSMALEDIHTASLVASLAQHEHVRETALRAFENHRLQEHQLRLQQIARQEAERLRLEQEQANLAAHIIQLQRQSIPLPKPPPVEKEPEVQKPVPAPAAETSPSPHQPSRSSNSTIASIEAPVPPPITNTAPSQPPARIAAISQQAQQTAQPQPPRKPETTNGHSAAQPPPTLATQQPSSQPTGNTPSVATNLPHILPGTQKYVEIHKVLKRLRAFVASAASQDKAFKMKMGDGRRQIRKSVGQLTDGAGANSVPVRGPLIYYISC